MKVLAIALSAPLLLLGAAYPEMPKSDAAGPVAAREAMAGPVTYRPCRPGPGDDRCIQLYERGVRLSYAAWLRERGVEEAPTRLAMGGPDEERARPRRHHREAHANATAGQRAPGDHGHGHHSGREARCAETDGQGDGQVGQGGEARGM